MPTSSVATSWCGTEGPKHCMVRKAKEMDKYIVGFVLEIGCVDKYNNITPALSFNTKSIMAQHPSLTLKHFLLICSDMRGRHQLCYRLCQTFQLLRLISGIVIMDLLFNC